VHDFAAARNALLAEAAHDWVLLLDSDEVVDTHTHKMVSEIIKRNLDATYLLRRIDYFRGEKMQYGEVGNTWLPRLARRRKISFTRPVHEVAVCENDSIRSELILKHLSHTSISEFFHSVSHYAVLDATFRKTQGEQFSLAQLCLKPLAKFFYNFIWLSGWRDGWRGYIYACMMSLHSIMVRVFLYEKTRAS
nr:glycosyltransferase [bacterium]